MNPHVERRRTDYLGDNLPQGPTVRTWLGTTNALADGMSQFPSCIGTYRALFIVAAIGSAAGCLSVPKGGDPTMGPDAGPGGTPTVDATATNVIDAPPPCVEPPLAAGLFTMSGCDTSGDVDGPRGVARFHDPVGVAVGPDQTIYVTDFDNSLLRAMKIDGSVTTLVRDPNFQHPFGIAFSADGKLYVETDDDDLRAQSTMTGTLWQVDPTTGALTVLVRDVGRPRGLLVLPDGRVVLSDNEHNTISLYDPATNAVTLLAGAKDVPAFLDGKGAAARFNSPYGVALLADGRIAVADSFNNRVRAVALDGTVTTIAGTGLAGRVDGAAADASFSAPQALAVDGAGTLYITDLNNFVVRRFVGGRVDTVIGSGKFGWLDASSPRNGEVYGLEGIAFGPAHNLLYLTDGSRGDDTRMFHRIRGVSVAILGN